MMASPTADMTMKADFAMVPALSAIVIHNIKLYALLLAAGLIDLKNHILQVSDRMPVP